MAKRKKPPFLGITPPYDILLKGNDEIPWGLYHLYIALPEQLGHLHGYSPKSIKLIKDRLHTLAMEGYVQDDAVPSSNFRPPNFYVLGSKGVAYLRQAGLDIDDSFRASKETGKHYLFIRHALELTDVLVAAAILKRVDPTYSLNRFIHERELKRKPYKVSWQGETLTLVPDAFLDFQHTLPDGSYRRLPVLLEHDCGTEQRRAFKRKIRAYMLLLKSEACTVAFTTFTDEQRREQMREWTRQELGSDLKTLGHLFLFTHQPQPPDPKHLWLEPCWYTPDGQQAISLLAD